MKVLWETSFLPHLPQFQSIKSAILHKPSAVAISAHDYCSHSLIKSPFCTNKRKKKQQKNQAMTGDSGSGPIFNTWYDLGQVTSFKFISLSSLRKREEFLLPLFCQRGQMRIFVKYSVLVTIPAYLTLHKVLLHIFLLLTIQTP